MARPHDHGAHHPGGPVAAGGVLSAPRPGSGPPGGDPDPDELLLALRRAGAEPPLTPLRLTEPAASARRGPARGIVSGARRAVLRLIAPSLADLIGQLERDRHRQRAEIADLERRIATLERERR
ncbi:MAG: hypothetical protein AB7V42_13185 [Thermoleophilia bacterium]